MTFQGRVPVFVFVIGFAAATASQTAVRADNSIFDQRFERARQNAIKQIEKRLATSGGGRDEDTWYVLVFVDRAARAENHYNSPYSGFRYWSGTAADASSCVKVLSRTAAAERILAFLNQAPEAPQKLRPTAYANVVRLNKHWDFRAFRSAGEAEAFYKSVKAPSKSPSEP